MGSRRRVGFAGVATGALLFAGQGGELLVGDDSSFTLGLFVSLGAAAIVALGLAFLGLRALLAESRAGRLAATVGAVGSLVLGVFAIQLLVTATRTGDVPDNFALFALGFLLVLLAHLALARPLRALVPRGW